MRMRAPAIDWQDLRVWNGSQQDAFEELCAQLAAEESPGPDSVFVRNAPPDGGVECYWVLPTGEEHAWQAKFFATIGDVQWRQLDDSVRTALAKHPRLKEYVVCVPRDLADPRLKDKTSSRQQWQKHVQKWESWATGQGVQVTFTYWGEHELSNRLMQDKHRGRVWYWFGKHIFSTEWFEQRLEEAIANADQRYLPALHITLDIQKIFDGIGRTPAFLDRFKKLQGNLRRAYRRVCRASLEAIAPGSTNAVDEAVKACDDLLQDVTAGIGAVALDGIKEQANAIHRAAIVLRAQLVQAVEKPLMSAGRTDETQQYYLYELMRESDYVAHHATSDEALLGNTPALLIVGDAGVGKTHLLCQVARDRTAQAYPTILILGEQLAKTDPWREVLHTLDLSCDADEFLSALDAAGEARGVRSLLMIDALNEGEGRAMWNPNLPGFLTRIARYPWVGVVLTVRKSYEEAIIGPGALRERVVRVQHLGFRGAEARATMCFFAHYGLVAPTIPPLHPEFSNPLFLRLFCQALQNARLQQLPPGLHGMTSVFDFFLESVNAKLCRPDILDRDPAERIVQQCVESIAGAMATKQRAWLPRDEARAIVEGFDQRRGYSQSIFRQLVVEGVVAEDRFHAADDTSQEGVRFTYEKFSDHLVVRQLLNKHLDVTAPGASFSPGMPLGRFVRDEWAAYEHRGFIEALAIQLPERIGQELPTLVPAAAQWLPVREAMIESLIWRAPTTFTETTNDYLDRALLGCEDTFAATMAALLTTATQIGHPYNARLLHNKLARYSMPGRDAWWTIYLHAEYTSDDVNIIARLLEWCAIPGGKRDLNDESLLLAGLTVAWFLTSSNRFLRDHATKALVQLLTSRLHLVAQLTRLFAKVDDDYVSERLLAAAYGCVLRSNDAVGVVAVAAATFEVYFSGNAPVHILVRDYARGIMERALHLDSSAGFPTNRIRPPYGSTWPKTPALEELKTSGYDATGVHPAQRRLCYSILEDDFARYVIGTNSGEFEWINIGLDGSQPPSQEERMRLFVQGLTPTQRKAWTRCRRANRDQQKRLVQSFSANSDQSWFGEVPSADSNRPDPWERAKTALFVLLTPEQQDTFRRYIEPLMREGRIQRRSYYRFDLRVLQSYILQRVFSLGWSAALFGTFDRDLLRHGREARKAERIGKKYQWIAYYEIHGLIADHFVFTGNSWSAEPAPFVGPWQVSGLRDIDPCLRLGRHDRSHLQTPACWWAPAPYTNWDTPESHNAWLKQTHDLPALTPWLVVTDPKDGTRWVTIGVHYRWEEPTPPKEEWLDRSHRMLWYQINAYIVRCEDADSFCAWAQRQEFWGRWMPEPDDFTNIFLGELYWSPSYHERFVDQRGQQAFTSGSSSHPLPVSVVVPSMIYCGVSTSRDCSIEEPEYCHVPSPWLAEALHLRWTGNAADFVDGTGAIVARDPSAVMPGARGLLVNEPRMHAFLDQEGYEIVWTVLGCKEIIGERSAIPAELHLNGVYRYNDGEAVGGITPSFHTYPPHE